jgi:hypothetical protein
MASSSVESSSKRLIRAVATGSGSGTASDGDCGSITRHSISPLARGLRKGVAAGRGHGIQRGQRAG